MLREEQAEVELGYLMGGRSLGHHNVSSLNYHGHSVRIQQLTVSLANLAELELEVPILIKDLDPVVVGVGHNDLVVFGDGDTTGLRELALQDTELSELAVVDHLLAPNLSLRWIGDGCGGHRSGEGHRGEG